MRGHKNCFKAFDGLWKRPKGNTYVYKGLENGALSAKKHGFLSSQSTRGYVAATSPFQVGHGRPQPGRRMEWMVNPPSGIAGTYYVSHRCKHSGNNAPDLNRDFFVKLWLEDRKRINAEAKRQRVNGGSSFLTAGFDSYKKMKQERQTSTSQPAIGSHEPSSLEEAQLAHLLARSNLLITRDIEWANLAFGFEQENRYAIVDIYEPHSPVGYMREQSNLIMRQLLRSRRPFVASITDAFGNELFRVRRPFWWINSSIYTEVNGKEIGVVHRRWHLWRRIYDLYLGDEQFAVVENPGFWNWTFTLKDINGEALAEIDRNWRGFGLELLTDAGQYAIRFGATDSSSHFGEIQELDVKHPLTLAQRAVTVALAVSLDNDYFSRHGGWAMPFFVIGE